ncbi:MAG: T9SS type A sorting domain-containing protein [Chryseobacterium sp.]|nr:T9SS type A sorting domain-containing protein [Chryseobacterium sp.]
MKKLLLLTLMCSISFGMAQTSCNNAVNLTAVGTYTVTGINGTAAPSACGLEYGIGTAGAWYKYTPTQEMNVTVSTVIAGQTNDTRIMVYSGNCTALACLASNDDYSGYSAQVNFRGSANTTYYIVFDNKWSSSGFQFKLSESVAVPDRLSFTSQVASGASSAYNNCIVDMNGDYLDDIVSVVNKTKIVISHQKPDGGFTDVTYTIPSTIVEPEWSIAAGDYDNNGFNDLIYGSSTGVTFVKANATGTGYTIERKTQNYLTQRTNFVDINNDGKLDAFVCDDNGPNRYYLNDGTNMNHNRGGLGDFPSGGNYASTWTDYDNDGDLDLFIAKCGEGGSGVGGNIDELHRNNGNGTFTNVANTANLAEPSQSWSAAWGDFNNDGLMDTMIGINSDTDGLNKIMKNNGDGTFTNVTAGSGYENIIDSSREYVTYDFDNDGFLDILGAGNTIMFGDGNFKFTPNGNPYNLNIYRRPVGDLNNDGFLDIQSGTNILINNGNGNKWLKVTLKGVESNRNGIGARVEIYGTWGKQIRDVQSGTGFGNMSTLNTHFGIGQASAIAKIVVKWPSGKVDTVENVTPNTTLNIVEGSTLSVSDVQDGKGSFTVYPNPSSDMVNFKAKKGFVPIEAKLYDMNGKIVLQKEIIENSISIKQLSSGTYLLVANDKAGNAYSQKIIKK